MIAAISRFLGTLLFGCQHLNKEPQGMIMMGNDGEEIPVFFSKCAVCGTPFVTTS